MASAKITEDVARMKTRRALSWVEDAQRSLSRAAEQLSPVRGAGREHARVLRAYRDVEALWYRLERLFDGRRLSLDREPLPSEFDEAVSAAARRAA